MEKSNLYSINHEWKNENAAGETQSRIRVFSYFLEMLLTNVEAGGHKLDLSFNVRILERISSIPLVKTDREKIRARLFGKMTTLPDIDLDEASMRRLFQAVYEELCDLIGPVKADTYNKAALLAAKRMPEATLYNPDNLL